MLARPLPHVRLSYARASPPRTSALFHIVDTAPGQWVVDHRKALAIASYRVEVGNPYCSSSSHLVGIVASAVLRTDHRQALVLVGSLEVAAASSFEGAIVKPDSAVLLLGNLVTAAAS